MGPHPNAGNFRGALKKIRGAPPKKNARMKLLYSQLRVHYDGIMPLPQVEPRLGMN